MAVYTGQICPVCDQKFQDDDDIVVCPICGAPHHRECYKKLGKCKYQDKHGKQESYRRPDEKTYDGYASNRCSRCGTINPTGNLFCHICGNQLNTDNKSSAEDTQINQQASFNMPPYQMPYNPFTNPFGGLDPEETIEDIHAKEIALFVGESSFYFLPKFKDMQNKVKSKVINWAAFFFQAYYFAYRKMYLWAAVIFLLTTVLSIPSLYAVAITYADLLAVDLGIENIKSTLASLYNWQTACSVLSFALRIGIAFAFNPLYKKFVIKSIHKIKSEDREEQDYYAQISHKGGVSRKIVGVIIIAMLILSFFSVYFIPFLGV